MSTKICFKCNAEKPMEDYYKHKQMGDGYLNKCKDCTKKDTSMRHLKLLGDNDWVAKEKDRHRLKYHRLKYRDRHKPTAEQRKLQMNRYVEKYPEKKYAKNLTCKMKPKSAGNHLHHWSYNEIHYKDVIELTQSDHYMAHRHLIYDSERKMYRRADNMQLLDSRDSHEEYLKTLEIEI